MSAADPRDADAPDARAAATPPAPPGRPSVAYLTLQEDLVLRLGDIGPNALLSFKVIYSRMTVLQSLDQSLSEAYAELLRDGVERR